MEQADRTLRVVELDIHSLEEVVPEDEVHARDRAFAAHAYAHPVADGLGDAYLLDPRCESARLAADACHPLRSASRGEAQLFRRRLRDHARVSAGIEEHADFLA